MYLSNPFLKKSDGVKSNGSNSLLVKRGKSSRHLSKHMKNTTFSSKSLVFESNSRITQIKPEFTSYSYSIILLLKCRQVDYLRKLKFKFAEQFVFSIYKISKSVPNYGTNMEPEPKIYYFVSVDKME